MILVHHIDDIANYLDTYRNIANGVSILDRSFVEMTLLKPVFCAAALVGLHITIPFQTLLIAKETNYSTLLACFPVLFDELNSIDPQKMCTTKEQVFNYVSDDIFKSALKEIKGVVLESIDETLNSYKEEVINLLHLILPRMAEGFSMQRGRIFESVKYKDLEHLKTCNGPFTTAQEVRPFDTETPESVDKNNRLYTEVRYAKKHMLVS